MLILSKKKGIHDETQNYTLHLLTGPRLVSCIVLYAPAVKPRRPRHHGTRDRRGPTSSAGDILEITTWKEVDFSREEVLVRLDGMITFPLINDIQAKGRTPMQVKADIEEKLGLRGQAHGHRHRAEL